ncbi:hypothetical protein AB4037_08670 [Labrys sp. KB_33_2]|uniref:hypothetical protein n=1 Tax=Labrys sp. KB_33_2 TaxID=3237479 RepID=UPI003F8F7738
MPSSFIRQNRTFSPDEAKMSAATAIDYDDAARSFVERIENLRGRDAAARAIGAGSGTLENIRRGRRKGISVGLFVRIQGAVIRELEKEIRTLEAEIAFAEQCGVGADNGEILAAQAAMQKAITTVERLTRRGRAE